MSLLLQILGISNSHVSPCLLQSNGFPWPHLLYQALITCCRCYCKGRFSSLFLSQQNCCVWNEKKKSILPTRSTATNESLNSSQCHRAFRQHQVIQENSDWSCVLWQTRVPSQTFLIWCYGNLTSRQVKGGRGSKTRKHWLYVTAKPEMYKLLLLSNKWSLFGVFVILYNSYNSFWKLYLNDLLSSHGGLFFVATSLIREVATISLSV